MCSQLWLNVFVSWLNYMKNPVGLLRFTMGRGDVSHPEVSYLLLWRHVELSYRECISRMCRTYLESLTLHKTAVKKPRDRRQTVPLPQWGGRVRAWKQDFQLKRQVINNGRPMLELNGLLQTMEQKITHIALNIFGTSKIDLAFRRTAETTC